MPFVVDAAQSAGHVPIDVQADCIDLLAAPGPQGLARAARHRVSLHPPGHGEDCSRRCAKAAPARSARSRASPISCPTSTSPAATTRSASPACPKACKWVLEQGGREAAAHELDLVRTFIDGVSDIEGLTYFGPQGVGTASACSRAQVEGFDPHELSAVLETSYGILTRPGIHCAPLMHAALGTLATAARRASASGRS